MEAQRVSGIGLWLQGSKRRMWGLVWRSVCFVEHHVAHSILLFMRLWREKKSKFHYFLICPRFMVHFLMLALLFSQTCLLSLLVLLPVLNFGALCACVFLLHPLSISQLSDCHWCFRFQLYSSLAKRFPCAF